MIKKMKNMFMRKNSFMDWDEYKARVDFLDTFAWQQSIRKRNLGGLE